MADNDSLSWEIEKIVDCKGNDMKNDGWVRINPMSGKGNTNAQVSVTPSSYWNDCKEAVVTISASTGDKKYITINRCNPECNCDAVVFTPETNIDEFDSSGGTKTIAKYYMKFCCDGKNSLSLVNVDGECDYEFVETANAEDPCKIEGKVDAIVGENESTTNKKTFSYYVTYNGVRCNQLPLFENAFTQARTINPCEEAACPTVTIEGSSAEIQQPGGQKRVIFSDEYKTLGCWEVTNVIDENGNRGFSYSDGPDDTLLLHFDANETYEEKTYNFTFVLINDAKGEECDIPADKVLVQKAKVKPVVPTCDTCQDINVGNVTEKTLPAVIKSAQSTYTIVDLDAECLPNSMRFMHKSGEKIIKNMGNLRISGEINVITSYNNINDNTSKSSRYEIIEYYVNNETTPCSSFTLHQEGAESIGCSIDVESITAICSNQIQVLQITAKKSDAQCDDMTLIYKIENTSITGAINVSVSEYATFAPPILPALEENDYYVKWYNQNDASNSGRTNIHIESCQESNVVTARIMLKADNGLYVYQIDNLLCYFESSNHDVKTIALDKNKWVGYDGEHRMSVDIPGNGHATDCRTDKGTYQFTLQEEKYTYIYQDVQINLGELNINSAGDLGYDFYAVEFCKSSVDCGCGLSSTASEQIKTMNGTTPVRPGVDWYGLWNGAKDAPKSYMAFSTDGQEAYGKRNIHIDSGATGGLYETRINFQMTELNEDDFHIVDDPELKGYDTIILISMWPKENNRQARAVGNEEENEENNENTEITYNER